MRNGKIILAKGIKFDKSYNQVVNISESDRLSIIENASVYSSSTYSFIRETGRIRVNARYGVCLQANYLAFQNPDYASKWFFAFIDKVNYISNGTSEIEYTVDVFSTWFPYVDLKPCFVVREHVTDDTVGSNTQTESVDLGEIIINSVTRDLDHILTIPVIALTDSYSTPGTGAGGIYGKVPSGLNYYKINNSESSINHVIGELNQSGRIEILSSLFIAPLWLVNGDVPSGVDIQAITSGTQNGYSLSVPKQSSLNGYTPRNKKLLTFPYCYTIAFNGAGGTNIYKQELFSSSNLTFGVEGVLTPGCSIVLYPTNYKSYGDDFMEILPLGKYPIGSFNTDTYATWLAQNSVNIGFDIVGQGISGIGNVASGNIGGAVGNLMSLAQTGLMTSSNVSLVPNVTKGNLNSGDVMHAMELIHFSFYNVSIKQEFARIIDDYFTHFGYRVNRIKTPNISRRQNYNYVQVDNSESPCQPNVNNTYIVPSNDLDLINNLFRRGVTIWNNYTNFGDYSVSNNIV